VAPEAQRTRTPVSLLERLRQPFEPEAWARFVALYTPLIYSWARGAGLLEQDAADLVQDVFVTLVQVLPTFNYDPTQSFRRWLRTITLNRWRDGRKRQAHVAAPVTAGDLREVVAPDDLEALWEAEYQQHLVGRALRLMQADFDDKTWRACWEVIVGGRSAAEVAAEFGLTVGAVHARKFRVLDRLREELAGMLE
jgi:RNA polymerase sigma-70 factor (ECF subfamily)